MMIVCYGEPVGKPRMTRADRWRRRSCVMRYWEWTDRLREAAKTREKITLTKPTQLHVVAHLQIPAYWGASKRLAHRGTAHTAKPDGSNILKGIEDALFVNDQMLFASSIYKFWDDGGGPRVSVMILSGEGSRGTDQSR